MTEGASAAPHDSARYCGARTRGGTPCGRPAGWGTGHPGDGRCKLHGGKAPQAERAAVVRRARVEAERLAIDLEVDQNPPEVLLAELSRSRALADLFEDRLARGEAALGAHTKLGPKMTVETELWQRERDRAIALSIACLKLGLEERRIKITEGEGRRLADAFRLLARELGVYDHPGFFGAVKKALATLDASPAER